METVTGELRMRRVRTASESLLSIVLGLETFLVFFATLVVFALAKLDAATVLVGGGMLLALLAFTAGMMRYRWAVWLGWVFQVILVAGGFLIPLMFFIGAGFATMWVYCFIAGRRLDRRNAASPSPASAAQTKENP